MEIAICQLLLGRKTEALSTLGVQSDSALDDGPDSGIRDFIRVCMLCLTLLAYNTLATHSLIAILLRWATPCCLGYS